NNAVSTPVSLSKKSVFVAQPGKRAVSHSMSSGMMWCEASGLAAWRVFSSVLASMALLPVGVGGCRIAVQFGRRVQTYGRQIAKLGLVPRTRSSPGVAARSVANFGFKSGTRIIDLLVSFDSEVRLGACRKVVANFGIGTLDARPHSSP